jgi:RNA polymerase sigma factor (sigma-70 family)
MLRELARLPHRQRAVLVLRYYEGWSENEIAAALGCSPGTVKTHAARGLSRLQQRLAPPAPPEGASR